MSSIGIDARPNSGGWLFGRFTDLMIGCGLGYILSLPILFLIGRATGATVWPGFLMIAMVNLINSPHYGATIVRAYEDREDRQKYFVFTVYITIALALLSVSAAHSVWLASIVTTVYFTWSPWHFAGQNYGLSVMFLRRRGIELDPTTKRLIYASFILSAGIAIWSIHSGQQGLIFTPQTLHVANAPTFMALAISPDLTNIVLPMAILAYVGCLVVAGSRLRKRGSLADLFPALCLVAMQALWFALPAVFRLMSLTGIGPLAFAAVWISTAHSIQYLWVTAYYARASEGGDATHVFLLKALAAGMAVAIVPMILLAPHMLGRLPWDAGLATVVFSMINLHHFILDGAIWKLRDGKVARALLRSSSSPASTGGAVATRRGWLRPVLWSFAWLAVGANAAMLFATNVLDTTDRPELYERAAQVLRLSGAEKLETRFELGRRSAARGDHEKAIEEFQRSLELFPTGRVWAALGVQYRTVGRPDLALPAFDSAIELNPAFFGAHYQRAEALLESASSPDEADANQDRAIASLERALELKPGHADAARTLARIQFESGNVEAAIRTLEKSVATTQVTGPKPLQRLLDKMRDARRSRASTN